LNSNNLPPLLKALEVYTKVEIQKDIKQLNNIMQELNVKQKLSKRLDILEKLFKNAKREVGPRPRMSMLFSCLREILYRGEVINLNELVDKDLFNDLKKRMGEYRAYDILAWGIVKFYVEKERIPPYVRIRYDP
jgi:hypothetical protein